MTEKTTERMLGGTGALEGPSPNTQFNDVVEFLKAHLSQFAESVSNANIENEKGLNQRLSVFITNAAICAEKIFFAHHENMEDETRGDSPASDIGIYMKVEDIGIAPPLITIFECKRLSTKLKKHREREYVVGHKKDGKPIHCGGIERFKLSIHGVKLRHAGMIGYLQDGTPDNWREKVNSWICDLSSQPYDPPWLEKERLTPYEINGRVASCSSIVIRFNSVLRLTHLWIDLK